MVHRGSDSGSGNRRCDAGRGPSLAALLLAAIAAAAPAAAQAVLVVPGDYASIDAALAAIAGGATAERTIIVEPGTRGGNITVPAGLPAGVLLRGRETARTILTGTLTINNIADFRVRNLTFTGNGPAIRISGGSVSVHNNVFRMNGDGVAIASTLSQPEIGNNVFWRGGVAIDAGGNAAIIENNAFAGNAAALASEGAGSLIRNNAFSGVTAFGDAPVNGNPQFVDPDRGDFHLRAGSPLIDAGIGTDGFDDSTSDIGAYGGEFTDDVPFPVQDLAVAGVDSDGLDHSVTLRWSANRWYRLGGYRLHYDTDGGAPYAGVGADQGDSPVDVGTVTEFTLGGLTAADGGALAPPVLAPAAPGDRLLRLEWTASPGASGYLVHYAVDDDGDEDTVDVGAVTRYTLTGLDNGVDYRIHVTAYVQQRYVFAMTAHPASGAAAGSAFSAQVAADIGPRTGSLPSNEVVDFPEAIVPFPNLPDGGGCFIATAVFGGYDAGEVRLLRRFRDEVLMPGAPGRAFVDWYYRHGPEWAAALDDRPALKPLARIALLPMIGAAALVLHPPALFAAILLAFALLIAWRGRYFGRSPEWRQPDGRSNT